MARDYLKWLATGAGTLILCVVALNWLVNPFSLFDPPAIRGLNANKPHYVEHLRLTHVYRVTRLEPECVLLGTSRAGRGLAPDHPALQALGCYNLALPAISVYEMRRYLQHAQSVRPLKLAILAMDFRAFSTAPDQSGAFSEARLRVDANGRKQFNLFSSQLPDFASSLISTSATLASLGTIRKQGWAKDTLAANGYWAPLTERYDHAASFEAYTRNSARRFAELHGSEDVFRKNLDELRRLLRAAYGSGIDVRLVFSPSHAWHWQTLWESGLWARFEDIKRQLVRINAEEAARAGARPYPVWDFSGSHGPALESVPAARGAAMHGFWEPVHYKRAVGDVLLARVMGLAPHDAGGPEAFGVPLDAATLEQHLAGLRSMQQAYMKNHPGDVSRIRALMRQTASHDPT